MTTADIGFTAYGTMEGRGERAADLQQWLTRNALNLVFVALFAFLGWTSKDILQQIRDDVRENTTKLEAVNTNLQAVMLEQGANGHRIEFLEDLVKQHSQRLDSYDARVLQFYQDYGKQLNEGNQ